MGARKPGPELEIGGAVIEPFIWMHRKEVGIPWLFVADGVGVAGTEEVH